VAGFISCEYADVVMRGVCVLPKSVTPSRIKENIDIVPLSTQERDVLEKFAESHGGKKRLINPPWGRDLGEDDGFGARKASEQN
jgi:glycerol 2-dehydrogenase (NADP+)